MGKCSQTGWEFSSLLNFGPCATSHFGSCISPLRVLMRERNFVNAGNLKKLSHGFQWGASHLADRRTQVRSPPMASQLWSNHAKRTVLFTDYPSGTNEAFRGWPQPKRLLHIHLGSFTIWRTFSHHRRSNPRSHCARVTEFKARRILELMTKGYQFDFLSVTSI